MFSILYNYVSSLCRRFKDRREAGGVGGGDRRNRRRLSEDESAEDRHLTARDDDRYLSIYLLMYLSSNLSNISLIIDEPLIQGVH